MQCILSDDQVTFDVSCTNPVNKEMTGNNIGIIYTFKMYCFAGYSNPMHLDPGDKLSDEPLPDDDETHMYLN